MTKCEWIATENICQKLYSFERKGKLNLLLNFGLSLSSFRVKNKELFRIRLGIVHALEVFDSWIVPAWRLKNKELFRI